MNYNRRRFIKFAAGCGVVFAWPIRAALALQATGALEPQKRPHDTANVLDFGARGDGTADDTEAIQAAINSAAMIYFPPGTYKVGSLKIDASGKYLFGSYKSSILSAIGTGDIFSVEAWNVRIRDLMFTNEGGTRLGGAYIKSSGKFISIDHCFFENGYFGVVSTSTLFTISDCDFRVFSPRSGICIQINGGFSVGLDRIRSDHPAKGMPFAGINITSTGDTTITNCNLMHCGADLLINPGAHQVVASLYASNTFFDTADEGIVLVPQANGAIVRSHFINCWGSSHLHTGARIDASVGLIDGITFIDFQANLNGGDGILISGTNTRNIQIVGGEMAGNKGRGIAIGQSVTKFYLHNVMSGAVHGLEGNDVGIHIGAGCNDYEVIECICQNNKSAQLVDESQSGLLRDNTGIITKASGAAFIPKGETLVIIRHGLAAKPLPSDIEITATVGMGANPVFLDTASITPAFFTVRCTIPAEKKLHFEWRARCMGN